jgi:diguanylate cyclase (GGDEF)-like protein
MNHSIYITTALGSSLILILIFINYIGKFNTDNFQRRLLLILLCATFAAIITDFISNFFDGESGSKINNLLYISTSLFSISQNCAYYLSVILFDYFILKNTQRTKKFLFAIAIFITLYSMSIIINLPFGYYFTISPDNHYVPEKLYPLRLFLSYGSILVLIINMLLSIRFYKRSQVYAIFLFLLIIGMGSAMDIIIKGSSTLWPCFTAAILYIYFFILQSDLKLDSLTRIVNRASFNEFIDKHSRQNSRQEYTIVMIDMDRFKEINDTLGHLEGDNALRDIATIIKSCIRKTDLAARYGGDEFVLAIEAEYDIHRVMNRIQDIINHQNGKKTRPYQLYISYGYDVYTAKSDEPISGFLARIDAMMYKQKEERKKEGIPSAITSKLSDKDGEENNV